MVRCLSSIISPEYRGIVVVLAPHRLRASIDNASTDVVNEASSILTASLREHGIIHVAGNVEIAETVSFNNNTRSIKTLKNLK